MHSRPLFIFCALILTLQHLTTAYAQPASSRNDNARSSRGKDFYFTFMPNFHEQPRDSANTRDSLFVFVTSDKPVSGRITYRNQTGRTFVQPFTISNPAEIYTLSLNYGGLELQGFNTGGALTRNIQNERPAPQHFRVEADDDVTVYALNQARFTSDAMLVYPVAALGREYVVMAYNSDGGGLNFGSRPDGDTPSQFSVVATEDNTEITIVPRTQTFTTNSTFVIPTTIATQRAVLQRGEAYLVQADTRLGGGTNDLTGSRVYATKPVAVFGGHQRTTLPVRLRNSLGSRDYLIEQLPPVETWGKSVFLVPHEQPSQQTFIGTDLYRVMAGYNNTVVFLNGIPQDTLDAGEFLERQLTEPGWITASDQILVAQFKKSANTAGGGVIGVGGGGGAELFGDPFMMIIPTVEQYDKSYRFINVRIPDPSPTVRGGLVFTEHYITIVVPTSGVNAIFLDNAPIQPARFQPIVNSRYSFANIPVSAGTHSARGDSAFGLYVYSYGAANSYGYIGGGKLRVIAPDRDAPRIAVSEECFGISGTLIDTLITDSRLERVTVQPSTLANVQISVEQFQPFADSVRFSARLVNPYQDGSVIIEAKDSIGFITRRTVPVYGFTVGLMGQGSMNTAPEQRFSLPVGRSRSLPVILTNYGSTEQTITALRFAQGGFGMRITRTLPFVLAVGARDTVRISYTALQDGMISDTLVVVSTCATRAVALLNVTAQSDRTPPSLNAAADPCGQVITLQSTETGVFASGVESLRPVNLVNATFRLDSANADLTTGRITVVNPRLDAIYTIQTRDSSGNTRLLTDTIQGFTIALVGARETVGRFTETGIAGTTNCISLQYRNVGLKPFVFDAVAPQLNRYFSVPVSQLPLVIPPGATRSIQVCFAPTELRAYRDTLILQRGCLGDTLVLQGEGISPERLANSRCDVPILLRTISVPTAITILNTAPNPASGKVTINMELGDEAWIQVQLFSASGNPVRNLYEGVAQKGKNYLEWETTGLEQGVYFCTVQAGTTRAVRQITILR